MFCVYITFYSGNQLPPFYIGSTSVCKISSGYHGSVRSMEYRLIWQNELKNNPLAFKTVILSTHETRLEALEKEAYLQRAFNVHKNPMFINKAITGEKFISPRKTLKQKQDISKRFKGKKQSQEHIEKRIQSRLNTLENNPDLKKEISKRMSNGLKGRKVWNKGKTGIYSKEHITKLSKSKLKYRYFVMCPDGSIIVVDNFIKFFTEIGFTIGQIKNLRQTQNYPIGKRKILGYSVIRKESL